MFPLHLCTYPADICRPRISSVPIVPSSFSGLRNKINGIESALQLFKMCMVLILKITSQTCSPNKSHRSFCLHTLNKQSPNLNSQQGILICSLRQLIPAACVANIIPLRPWVGRQVKKVKDFTSPSAQPQEISFQPCAYRNCLGRLYRHTRPSLTPICLPIRCARWLRSSKV